MPPRHRPLLLGSRRDQGGPTNRCQGSDWERWGAAPVEERARRVGRTLLPAALILLFQQIAFPIPAGVALHGVIIGLLTAMVSVGMALVYRANRILNFAQADLGYIPASLSVMIVITSGLPWLVAFGAGLRGRGRARRRVRAAHHPPVLPGAAPRSSPSRTLGLTQLLAFGGLILPRAFGEKVRSQRIDPPFDFTFEVDPLVFNANHVLVLVVAPIAILGVGLFLQRTAVGVAIRAAADRSDRASLLGVPVKSLHTIVWTIAGGARVPRAVPALGHDRPADRLGALARTSCCRRWRR